LVGGEQFAEVGEEGAVLQAAGDRCGEGSFGEPFAVVGLVAVGEFAVDDRSAERALGSIVRWGYAGDGDERPERGPELP